MADPVLQRDASRDLRPGGPNLALMPTLMLSIGLLVLLSVGLIVAVNWVTGRAIVQEFATRLIARALSIQEMALRRHLDAAVDQATFIADAIRDGRYKLFDPALDDFISGTMAAAPQVGGLILADPSGKALRVVRGASNTTLQLDHPDITGDRQLAEIADEIRLRKDPYWGPPVYRERTQTTSLNYRVPIRKGDVYLGFVTLAVSTRALSILVKELSEPPRSVAFMLYGRDRILAHQALLDGSRKAVGKRSAAHAPNVWGSGYRKLLERAAARQGRDKAAARNGGASAGGRRRTLFPLCAGYLRLRRSADHDRLLRSGAGRRRASSAVLLGIDHCACHARGIPDCGRTDGQDNLRSDPPGSEGRCRHWHPGLRQGGAPGAQPLSRNQRPGAFVQRHARRPAGFRPLRSADAGNAPRQGRSGRRGYRGARTRHHVYRHRGFHRQRARN